MDIVACITGFGLASAAGSRACLVLVALGLFHHTEHFRLSPAFAWVGSPVVICVAAVLALVEIVAESHPEISELVTVAAYLPKATVGFISLAAATGQVDPNLLALAASGVLGAGTASAVHYLRSQVRDGVHATAGHVSHHAGTGFSLAETSASGALAAAAVFTPPLAAVAVVVLGLGTWFVLRKVRRAVERAVEASPGPAREGAGT